MKLTKQMSDSVDLRDATFEEDPDGGGDITAKVETRRFGAEPIVTVSSNGRIDIGQTVNVYNLSTSEFAELVTLVNEALIKAGYAPILEDRDTDDRLDRLEEAVGIKGEDDG